MTRGDHVINDNARLYVRYAYQKSNPFTGNVFFPDSTYSPSNQNNFVVGYTQVLTPNLVSQFQVGRNYVALNSANGFFVDPSLQSRLDVLTIPGYANPPGNPGEPSVSISSYQGLGSGARNSLQTDEVWTFNDTLSWNRGAHNFIGGFDISRVYTTRFAANNPRGSFSFNGTMTGDAAADFMRGLLVAATTPTVQLGSAGMQWRDDFFILDKWNATRRLSLNIGLRYELPTVPVSPSGIANALNPEGTALVPSTKTPNFHFTLPNHSQWAPRFGFAYRLGSNWVVRGGIGVYYSPDTTNTITILSLNPPFGSNFSYNTSRANPVMTFSNPNPVSALGTASPTPDIVTIGPYFPSAMMNQWSFEVQRTLWRDAALDVEYLGSHTYHLDTSWQQNAPLPGPGPIQSRRPNQRFGNIRRLENQAYSNYEGMNVVFTQRTQKGLSMQWSYTWSHSLDQSTYSTGGGQIVNPNDWRADYGNSSDDIRHRVVGNYMWQMPFFRNTKNAFLRKVAGGWSLSGIGTIQTGSPVNVTISQDQANTGQGSQRPNLVGKIDASSCGKVLIACVNSNAFVLPSQYTYGNAGRNLFYGPGSVNFATSLAKAFRFAEKYAFQFRRCVQHVQSCQLGQPEWQLVFSQLWQHYVGRPNANHGAYRPADLLSHQGIVMPQNASPSRRPKIAVLANIYRNHLHTQHILDRILFGYGFGNVYHPFAAGRCVHICGTARPGDLTAQRAKQHPGMKVYPTVADALTLGTSKLAVEEWSHCCPAITRTESIDCRAGLSRLSWSRIA